MVRRAFRMPVAKRPRRQRLAGSNKRHRKGHALAAPAFEVLPDGAHAVTVGVYTRNQANLQTGNSVLAGIFRKDERAKQRATVLEGLFGVGVSFRDVLLVRLAPSSGLDTGGLWYALKASQDAVAEHLGIDDGPKSPASWRMEQEYAKAYGVRIELRAKKRRAVWVEDEGSETC